MKNVKRLLIDPFYENYDSYLEEYVVPEVIAFYIASSFYRNAMWEATFKQHFNSAFDTFNLICKNYKNTRFALWTKNVDILISVFSQKKYRKPRNLSLIISSPLLNVAFPVSFIEKINAIVCIDVVFTVYTKDFVEKNNITINCGAKHCLSCLQCYKGHKETIYINEQLK